MVYAGGGLQPLHVVVQERVDLSKLRLICVVGFWFESLAQDPLHEQLLLALDRGNFLERLLLVEVEIVNCRDGLVREIEFDLQNLNAVHGLVGALQLHLLLQPFFVGNELVALVLLQALLLVLLLQLRRRGVRLE